MKDTPIFKLLLKLSPPVMLALLIQSIYNIVDSYFVARYAPAGLTALSIIFPVQLLLVALATGTGAGLNILLSRMDGAGEQGTQAALIRSGLVLGCVNYVVFTAASMALLRGYYALSSDQALVRTLGVQYAQIVLLGSLGQFLEANCTKILQARGNMVVPMAAQIVGALINVALDPLLIFGLWGLPELGIAGAAIATVIGQFAAMVITLIAVYRRPARGGRVTPGLCAQVYRAGLPSIVMQALYTLYIVGLNLILKQFTEDAVTVLGIYYKLQTLFFIPLFGLEQVILPVISFNYGAAKPARVRETLRCAMAISCGVMVLATAVFLLWPRQLLGIFSDSAAIFAIGVQALRAIAVSFVPAGAVMMFTAYFQGVNRGRATIAVTILRQVLLLVPLAWVLHFFGLRRVWYTFTLTEVLTLALALVLYRRGAPQADRTACAHR